MKYIISSALLLAVPAFAAPTTPSSLFERQSTCAAIPSGYTYKTDAKLPDPFTTAAGAKVATLADWECRKAEIRQLFAKYELGDTPPKPATVTGTVSSSSISVSVSDGGKSISFSAKVTLPSGGTAPYPMLITIGGSSLPALSGVGTIAFGNDEMAQQQGSGSRGKGKFYDLYGSGHSAGATTAWAWGVSRIIDVIEANPSSNIDLKRLAVTGCSRNGKGAFIVGALEERIALTIPQESGSGGAACWRISDSENSAGKKIQTAGELVGEDPWFSKNLDTYAKSTSTMAVDHHMLAALIAPRALLVIENNINWLGPVSTTGCQRAGLQIYKALSVSDHMGFSESAEHSHCQFPSSQQPELTAFVNRFLKGGSDSTAGVDKSTESSVTASTYASWTAPILT
ncbi:hypothetical protein G7Y89_g9497 [Cudoniella acicularis]|uniref:(4-O-methyl)-D-glucuronate--lignin esterase n=1 Tax=Cudoniella acicularis TaxID=354080 RepID=A0A8H4REJ4_9HELO|nr:hypothetical protein G7Y89_g9497 [Cudoniella acicularis]